MVITMNTTKRFYKEVDLRLDSIDHEFLYHIRDTYKSSTIPVQGVNTDGTLRPVFYNYRNFYIKDAPIDYSGHQIYKKIAELYESVLGKYDIDYAFKRSHLAYVPGTLPHHVDARDCVLTIPIGTPKHPIEWVDDSGKIIQTYGYDKPSIINTRIKHGCVANDEDRFLFQVGIHLPYAEVTAFL